MAAGALSGGYISDRFFAGKRSVVIAGSLFLCAACIITLPSLAGNTAAGATGGSSGLVAADSSQSGLGSSTQVIAATMMIVSGYMLYLCIGPYFSLPADLLGTEVSGTGIGVLNAMAYVGAGVGTAIVGFLIESHGYTAGFWFMAICAIAGGIIICFVRR